MDRGSGIRGVCRMPAELKKLAQDAGLVPADVRGAVYYPRRRMNIGAAFLALVAKKPCVLEPCQGDISR